MKLSSRKKSFVALAVCLAICLVSLIASNLTVTNLGKVELNNLNLSLPTGETVRVLEYRPANATTQTPAPAIVFSHGNDNTAETYQNYALELARRGFVVFAPDLTSAGLSSPVESDQTIGYSMYDLVEYLYGTLDYVDNSRIGITGYSKGGVNVMDTMNAYGREQRESPETYEQRVAAAFVMAPKWDSMEGFATGINVGLDVGMFDPYSRLSFAPVEGYFPGDLSVKAEIKEFINQGVPGTFTPEQLTDPNTAVQIGHVYGSYEDGTGRVVYNAGDSTHGLGSVSSSFIRECVQFFTDTLGAPVAIAADSQVWGWNFAFSALGILAVLAMIVPLCILLANLPFFKPVIQPVGEPCAQLKGAKDKVIFVVVSLGVAFLSPLIAPKMFSLANSIFELDGHAGVSRWFLLGGMANSVLTWTTAFALINLAVFLIFYFAIHRRNGLRMKDFGARITLPNVGRTILLAALVFVLCYLVACFGFYVFGVGFRLVDMSWQFTSLSKLGLCMRYVPFYLFFWVVNSLIMNGCNRFKGMRESVNLLLCIGCNIIGLVVIAVIYYATMFTTGAGLGEFSAWKAYMAMLYMILTMTVGTIVNRRVYLKTGSIYLGPAAYATVLTVMNYATYMIPDYLY